MTTLLKFGRGNAKLDKTVATFSLPAGHTCPGARECLSKAHKVTGKITDGPQTQFRCFAATSEAAYTTTRQARHHNFKQLLYARTAERMAEVIVDSHPGKDMTRVHVSGDFFNKSYFRAWMLAAERLPELSFYAYTKELKAWTEYLVNRRLPENFSMVASRGGKYDHMIDQFGLREAIVVFHPEEAERNGWEIDHDDHLAMDPHGPKKFALLLHGTQPKGTEAAEAKKRMDREKVSYAYKAKVNKR